MYEVFVLWFLVCVGVLFCVGVCSVVFVLVFV